MAELIFWTALAGILYVYLGYPLVLAAWSRLARRPVRKAPGEPSVSLIVAVHNEREFIHRKIRNCLNLDYPADKLQLIISLDGPTDNTDTVVWKAAKATGRIGVASSRRRRGKAAAINSAVAAAQGDLLVFADARQWFDPNAIRELAANFSDPSVGAVSGELILLDSSGQVAKDGVGLYWRYEKRLRAMESEIHSLLGATGAIYAIRRNLFEPLPENTILDDVLIPIRIVLKGWRSVFDPAARAYDAVSGSPAIEYRRKVRTLMGNFQLVTTEPALLAPFRNPVFFQFVSHKLGRLLVPYLLSGVFLSNLFLLHGLYLGLLVCQAAFYLLALAGAVTSRRTAGGGLDRNLALPGKRG